MDEDGESSDGEGGRIALIQRQAKRRLLNMRHAPRESIETTATLPEYTSSPPAESSGTEVMTSRPDAPPKYPQLTAEEADEERDEVGDVMRRVRVRRRRSMSMSSSGSDPYLDSLLARSVHALELSNALLQSSMTTQSSLSALLSHDDRTLDRSLDSHARFLAGQIHASDARRAWVDDIARQVDSLEYEYPPPSPSSSALGLSQSLPDTQGGFLDRMRAARISTEDVDIPPARPRRREAGGGLQRGERPRSPPPRCMTQYINAEGNVSDGPDSILIPSTNGLRAGARMHALVEGWHSRKSSRSQNNSRGSSVEWSEFARQQQQRGTGTSTPVSPRSSNLHSPRRSVSVSAQHSPHASVSRGVYQHGNMSSPQVLQHSTKYASHQSHTPVRPVLSAVPAEPSTPAYNMLSAIVMRSPAHGGGSGYNSDSGGVTRSDLGPRFTSDLGPRLMNDLGGSGIIRAGLEGRPGRGRGGSGTWVAAASGAGREAGLRRTRSVTPSSAGGASPVVSPSRLRATSTGTGTATTTMSSPSKHTTQIAGTSSPGRSKPATRTSSRTTSSASVASASGPGPSRSGPTSASGSGRVVRHPYLQTHSPRQTQNQNPDQTESDAENDPAALQKYRSADALRRILDASKPQHDEPEEEGEDEERGRGTVRAKGKQPAKQRPRLPTWSVMSRTGTTVKVETLAPGGVVSIEGISGAATSPSTGGSKSAVETRFKHDRAQDLLELPGEHPRPLLSIAVPQRSHSSGPSSRLGSLFSAASLPKISVFGMSGEPEPPPIQESTDAAERERPRTESDKTVTERPRLEPIDTGIDGLPRRRDEDESLAGVDGLPKPGLRLQLNGTPIDTDAGPSDSRVSLTSESGSENGSEPSHASLPLPPRMFDHYDSERRPSSLRLSGSPRPSSFKQPGSGASTPRSVTFSPLPPKHVSSGSRPLSEAKIRRRKNTKEKKEKPGWFASWFGPLPSPSGSSVKSGGYGTVARRGWDSPRSMDDWQM